MKKIAIVTATRAEYGLLTPLIRKVTESKDFILDLIVTGTHLSEKHGYTLDCILKDGFPVAHKIPILEKGNTPYDISVVMANAIKKFAACFQEDRPDMVVILGDRTEMLGVASAAMNERIPIAHIHGGEITEGAVDDCVRHALTKMSYLHFTSADVYRRRVIQLGEQPERVFNVGSLGAENILKAPLLTENEIRSAVGIPENMPYALVTFHPVTLEDCSAGKQAEELCKVMAAKDGYFYLLTKANADAGGDLINQIMEAFAHERENVSLKDSLGMISYLSALKYASFVMGNSSSGILEAPLMGIPAINIGDRQKGRLTAETVINCKAEYTEIVSAIDKAERMPHVVTHIYGDGTTSAQIMSVLQEILTSPIEMKKKFFDVNYEVRK